MLKKRIINIRVMFVIFCGLMVGILFPYVLIKNISSYPWLIVLGILLTIVSIGLYIYAHLTHKYNLKIKYREDVSIYIKYACIGFLLAFITGMLIICQPLCNMAGLVDYGNSEVTVSGIVSDYVLDKSTYNKFIISDCSIDSGDSIISSDYKVCVYASNFVNVELGDRITFKETIDRFEFYQDGGFGQLIQGIGYKTFISGDTFIISDGEASLKDSIKSNTKDVLDSYLNEDNSNISYAILFGEKQGLNEGLKDMFSYAGISHILAVSGLHIGVLFAFIYFILKKLKINRFVRLLMLSVIFLFYCYLCSFTPSVCRASIMAMLLALCNTIHWEYDILSSMSIAGIIILLFNPLALFTISFQLSFLCIFAIIALAPTLIRLLKKIKAPDFLASTLAISIATNLVIVPVCMNVFTKVSLLGIITNVFVLPVFSVVYVTLFFIVLISLVWSGFGILLFVPNLFLHIIKTIANYVSCIPFGIFRVFQTSYWVLLIVIVTVLILHFLMIRRFIKGSVVLLLLMSIIIILFANSIPNRYYGDNLLFYLKYKSNVCYYVKDYNVTMIGSDIEYDLVMSEMKKNKLKTINTIIAYDFQLNDIDNLLKIIDEYNVENIYLPSNFGYKSIENKFRSVKYFNKNVIIGNLKFNSIVYKNQVIGVTLNLDDIGTILIPEIKPTKLEANYLMENYANIDYIYINSDNINIDVSSLVDVKVICNEQSISADIELAKVEKFILNTKHVGAYI